MHKPDRKKAREALFQALDVQMKENNPPAIRETFNRLRAEGYSRKETMKLIAAVLLCEMNDMIKNNTHYNESSYVTKLNMLPLMPWEYEPEDEDNFRKPGMQD